MNTTTQTLALKTPNFDKNFNWSVTAGVMLWGIFVAVFVIRMHEGHYFRHLFLLTELPLNIVIAYLSWHVYKQVDDKLKKDFFILFLSSVVFILGNFQFNIFYFVFKMTTPTSPYTLSYVIPTFVNFLLQLVFWLNIFNKYILEKKIKPIYLIIFFIFNILLMRVYITLTAWKFSLYSYMGMMELARSVVDLVLFDLLIFVLACCKNKGMYLLAMGMAIITAANFWEKHLFDDGASIMLFYGEFFWCLGLLLVCFGLYYMKSQKEDKVENWMRSIRSIKSQLALWISGLLILSFVLLFLAGYASSSLGQGIILSFPFLTMIYALFVVLLADFFGSWLERPFKKLESNISAIMGNTKTEDMLSTDFFIEEFRFLQKFLINAFKLNEEKKQAREIIVEFILLQKFLANALKLNEERNQAKKAIADLALQVAHDIRSPASAILMLAKDCTELPEDQRLFLREAANRIQDIANNLLTKSDPKIAEKDDKVSLILASTAILLVLSEKKVQYKNDNITLRYDFSPNAVFAFFSANLTEFKRVLSNLLNNAIEAMGHAGEILIKLSADNHFLRIDIIDSGKGMSEEVINKILSGQVVSDKVNGMGLGFCHARAFLTSYEGEIKIASQLEVGSEISLLFKKQPCASWIAEEVSFDINSIIVILDDDLSIHGAWDRLFASFTEKYPKIEIIHFMEADVCIEYFKKASQDVLNRVLFLSDYELIKQSYNGLDVIEITQAARAILVTSHFEDAEVQKRAALLNTKILPKILASEIVPRIKKPTSSSGGEVDLVIVEDNKEFSDILSYLCEFHGKKVDIYHNSYDLFENISLYDKQTKICLDLYLESAVDGIEVAKILHERGYCNLYLASGTTVNAGLVPDYITILPDKMSLLNL